MASYLSALYQLSEDKKKVVGMWGIVMEWQYS